MALLQAKILAFWCFIIFFSGLRADDDTHLFVEVSSLLHSDQHCTPLAQAGTQEETGGSIAALTVVHKHGPCYQATGSLTQMFDQDQSRVDWIHAHISGKDGLEATTDLPAKSIGAVNAGNYIVRVGLGTPKKDLSLIFDTASGLTWTQCQPCARFCHKQKDPIFAPSESSTYANVSCGTPTCELLRSSTGVPPQCYNASACVYSTWYGTKSFSVGLLASEKLTLGPSEVFDKIYVGCGQYNEGSYFGESAGILGLSRDEFSFVSQTAQKYGQYFSYCLPSNPSFTGRLTFGKGGRVRSSLKYVPLVPVPLPLYFIETLAISVAGKKLPIDPSIFPKPGTVLDSGIVITRMPPSAYKIMRDAFRQMMSTYQGAPPFSIFDTCYDFSNQTSVLIPKISFFFGGNVEISLGAYQILHQESVSQVCLAFAANNETDNRVMVFGSFQQQTYDVVYDVAGGRIGFGADGCM